MPETRPTLHVLAPFHTYPSRRFSHCAFTGKVLRFASMMKGSGYRIVEYANEGSESEADEHVVVLKRPQWEKYFPIADHEMIGKYADIGSSGHHHFERRAELELLERLMPGDILCHPFGKAHGGLVGRVPAVHVESGIGYEDEPISAYRIFESYTWQHWHLGRHNGHKLTNKLSSFVVPNYYDETDWPLGDGGGREGTHYVAYMASRDPRKGLWEYRDLILRWHQRHPTSALEFHVAGQGRDGEHWRTFMKEVTDAGCGGRVVDRGVLTSGRAAYLGGATAIMCHTRFTEPFGGASVEAMLCGTPVLCPTWGSYVEQVDHGETGFRCRTANQYADALERCLVNFKADDREKIRKRAVARFTYEPVRARYVDAFETISRLEAGGWLAA
jgi:glycosyltransferase involved in cell wall biosynthesis